jgi:Cu+-exporting ATPase
MELDDGRIVMGDAAREQSMTATDPVCGMKIARTDAAAATDYQGTVYYFCSQACHQRFLQAPEQYAVSPAASP